MSQGVREKERIESFYSIMSAISDKAEDNEEEPGTISARDFRNAVTESLFIVGRRAINDWYNRCVDLGFIVKLGSGNLHYNAERWLSSPIYRAARKMHEDEQIEKWNATPAAQEALR